MARVQLFFSSVSAEFFSYRERLRHLLTRPDVEVKVQEDFIVTGDETLEMLDRYIQGCDGVIHLVGDMTGDMAKPQSVAAIAQRYPELASRYPLADYLQPGGPSLSYTQWEAWLALLHGKKLYIATPSDEAPRDEKYCCKPEQQNLQRTHLTRLRGVERFPGTLFGGREELAAEVMRSFVVDLLVEKGLNPNPYSPHNLPDLMTSPEWFVGRSHELEQLKTILAPEGNRAYLTGMGGVGKSELAIRYAYVNLDFYRGGIVLLDARLGLSSMASQLVFFFKTRFPSVVLPEDRSPLELLPLCWSQWPAGGVPQEPVLLILDDQRGDNLQEEQGDKVGYTAERQFLKGLPPRFRRLISQREAAPTGAQSIDLLLLERQYSLELLTLQAGTVAAARLQVDIQVANDLCAEVGDLPLALVLLGARLARLSELRPNQLLADLRFKGADAESLKQAHPELGANRGVVEALLISWAPLSDAAKSLGVLLVVMAPAVIPWELVEACRLPEQKIQEYGAFDDELAELRHARLLERFGDGLYRLHPLVRQFIRLQIKSLPEVAEVWQQHLAAAAARICEERISQTLTLVQIRAIEPMLPHIRHVCDSYSTDLNEESLYWPFFGLSRVAQYQGSVEEALRWSELGLKECEKRLGPTHPTTAVALNEMAMLMTWTKQLKESESLIRRALIIDENTFGPDHHEVAKDLTNLACVLLLDISRLPEAESLIRRALTINKSWFGDDHPKIAEGLSCLALVMKATKRPKEAEQLMRQALAVDENSYGLEHPNIAIRLNNLAAMLMVKSDLLKKVADVDCLRTLSLPPKKENGVSDSATRISPSFDEDKAYHEAMLLMQRALEIDEASYGSVHPNVAIDLNNLAVMLLVTGSLDKAEPLMRRALAINEACYGCDHPRVAQSLGYLETLSKITLLLDIVNVSSYLILLTMEIRRAGLGSLFLRLRKIKNDDSLTILDLDRLVGLLEGTMKPVELKNLLIKETESLRIHITDVAWSESIDTIMGILLVFRFLFPTGIDSPLQFANRQAGAGPSIERLENTRKINFRYPADDVKANADSFSASLLLLMRITYLLRAPLLAMLPVFLLTCLKCILTHTLNRAGLIKYYTIATFLLFIMLMFLILPFQRMSQIP